MSLEISDTRFDLWNRRNLIFVSDLEWETARGNERERVQTQKRRHIRRETCFSFESPQHFRMKFEDLLEELDGFGRFQKMIVILSFIGRFTLPCHFLLNNYIGAIPPHHCQLGSVDGNITQEQRMTVRIPKQEDGTFTSCHMFSEPQLHLLDDESNFTDAPVVECQNGWTYDNSTFISTLATEVRSFKHRWTQIHQKAACYKL